MITYEKLVKAGWEQADTKNDCKWNHPQLDDEGIFIEVFPVGDGLKGALDWPDGRMAFESMTELQNTLFFLDVLKPDPITPKTLIEAGFTMSEERIITSDVYKIEGQEGAVKVVLDIWKNGHGDVDGEPIGFALCIHDQSVLLSPMDDMDELMAFCANFGIEASNPEAEDHRDWIDAEMRAEQEMDDGAS